MTPRLGTKTLGSEWVGMELDTDLYGYRAFAERAEELGTIQDYIFDEAGRLRYLIVDTGFWIFGKRVLIPAGLAEVDDRHHKVLFHGLSRHLLDELPAFENLNDLDTAYENELLKIYSQHIHTDRHT